VTTASCNGTRREGTAAFRGCAAGERLVVHGRQPQRRETCQSGVCSTGIALPNGTSCSDGNVCNGAETCQAGACVDGLAPNCVDPNPCTFDNCDPIGGCSNPPRPNGSSCDNDDVCDGVAACTNGQCIPGQPLLCGDQDPATVDGCDPASGCTSDFLVAGTLLNIRKTGLLRRSVKVKTADLLVVGAQVLGNGTAADPVLHGATVRIVPPLREPVRRRFTLPAVNWKYIGDAGENLGYRYRDRSTGAFIRSAQVKSGKPWKFAGKGDVGGPELDLDPSPVSVHLKLGIQRYCLRYGGEIKFEPFKKFRAEDAPAPASCTP
jgi:hypothetical protein